MQQHWLPAGEDHTLVHVVLGQSIYNEDAHWRESRVKIILWMNQMILWDLAGSKKTFLYKVSSKKHFCIKFPDQYIVVQALLITNDKQN